MSEINVEVMMSTYNGEKYVKHQIQSILEQNGVEVHITIRDDGSTDHTVDIINSIRELYPLKINLLLGTNIGYKKSFLKLLSECSKADYYAFSDQDDIWMPDKLKEAILLLEQESANIKLYSSNLYLVDSNLNLIRKTNLENSRLSLQSDFVRHRYAGCTYVFSEELREIASRINLIQMSTKLHPSHDFFLSSLALSTGIVLFDKRAFIKHIRLAESITAGGNGFFKRLKREINDIFLGRNYKYNQAVILYDNFKDNMNNNAISFILSITKYKCSIIAKMKLLFDKNFSSGIFIVDLLHKIEILFSLF